MTVFMTSSPCVIGADRAILSPANGFIDNFKSALPPRPRVLYVCADPDNHADTDGLARDFTAAFVEAGIDVSHTAILDSRYEREAQLLIW